MMWVQTIVYIGLPLFLIIRLMKTDTSQRLWFIEWLSTAMFVAFIFVLGPWHIFIYYLRYVWVVFFIIVSILSFRRIRKLPVKGPEKDKGYKFSMTVSIVLAVYFGYLAAGGLSGYAVKSEHESVELEFPMEEGVFAVGHGGSDPSINYHNAHLSQQYAYDILQLNGFGLRAFGITPSNLDQYKIYEAALYSPCSGEVLEAVDEYEDISPLQSESDPEEPAGNHVILSCEDTEIHIAHMKPGTVEVEQGDVVNTGAQLGEVGNTGNTTEPHLHIHAEREGEGVPITFNDRFLKRNSLVFN
ncbi:M23 family metallopeptidase [Halobacillus sp. A5]|uniref:M23 family metallopeptidase n=1 Tax=Halobacillus sp. A5 TaxID=2880263 RepID=UPI0020A67737|nr:M23 family metallopeptidase [Halobacillus sp. A5]MCP3028532.1 M23 family metallopeptidase [Halobacillus sp. A5]